MSRPTPIRIIQDRRPAAQDALLSDGGNPFLRGRPSGLSPTPSRNSWICRSGPPYKRVSNPEVYCRAVTEALGRPAVDAVRPVDVSRMAGNASAMGL
jgi:hypothetical protein